MRMSARLTFTTLGEDVLNIIISALQFESLRSLRSLSLASKYCKALVEPLLYRSIELSDADKKLAFTERKIHRLLDPNDSLSRHVRDLTVSEFRGDSGKLSAVELANIIGGLFRLQSFNWNANADTPECVVAILEKQWPGAKLIVGNHDRQDTDTRLLSSPLLYALTFGINNWKPGHEAQEQHSKLPELRDILLKNPQLSILDIRTKYSWIQRKSSWPEYDTIPHLVYLPLVPSDRLPPLHELRFSGPDTYELDLQQCQLLNQCMTWHQLHTLDLGLSCPQHFFKEIGGRLVSLKSLTMGIRTGDRRYEHWKYGPMTCGNLTPVKRFIKSVPGLAELHITDLDAAADAVVPAILSSQKSLHTLSYHASMHRTYQRRKLPYSWTTPQLKSLHQQCPHLSNLELDFPLNNGKWPSAYARTLTHFTNLKTLKIWIELNNDASDFAAKYYQDAMGSHATPRFNEALGRKVTTNLFRNFFQNGTYARLTSLDVCFTRIEQYDRGQTSDIEFPFRARRLERDDAVRPVAGGFVVECQGSWLGGSRW